MNRKPVPKNPDELRARVRALAGSKSQGAIARELGVSQNFVWRALKEGADEPRTTKEVEAV